MNEIVTKFLVVGDKSMPETYLHFLDLYIVRVDLSRKRMKEKKNLKNHAIVNMYTNMH